jgi:phospholipase C
MSKYAPSTWFCGMTLLLCGAGCEQRAHEAPRNAHVESAHIEIARGALRARSPAQNRAECRYAAGDLPAETLDRRAPHGDTIPIDHFVVVMQENRSFDHYFQMLPQRGVEAADVAPADFSDPDPDAGGPTGIFHETQYCETDVPHDATGEATQYADGMLNGFLQSARQNMHVLGYYDEPDLPYYYALARTFAIGDRYFCGLLGPTWPNRMFMQSGTSFGLNGNGAPDPDSELISIYHQLQTSGQSWMIYADGQIFEDVIYPRLRSEPGQHFATMKQFYADAMSGNLPAFAWVESQLKADSSGTDEHPPADIQLGQHFVAQVISALFSSPNWSSSALFLTYDENGGFFDHVPPPPACPPTLDDAPSGAFSQYGLRVPFIVVSPYARAHYVSHDVLSHTSVLRMVQARFDLPALTARDANSQAPFDLFDFSAPSFAVPPSLPDAVIDADELARCKQTFVRKSATTN